MKDYIKTWKCKKLKVSENGFTLLMLGQFPVLCFSAPYQGFTLFTIKFLKPEMFILSLDLKGKKVKMVWGIICNRNWIHIKDTKDDTIIHCIAQYDTHIVPVEFFKYYFMHWSENLEFWLRINLVSEQVVPLHEPNLYVKH